MGDWPWSGDCEIVRSLTGRTIHNHKWNVFHLIEEMNKMCEMYPKLNLVSGYSSVVEDMYARVMDSYHDRFIAALGTIVRQGLLMPIPWKVIPFALKARFREQIYKRLREVDTA